MKILKLNLSVFLLILFSIENSTVLFSQSSRFGHNKFITTDNDTLNYRMLISDYDSISRYPLVIFLHGSGERGNDNESQLKWGVMNFASDRIMKLYQPIVIAPQCPENMDWGNYFYDEGLSLKSTPTKPMKLLLGLIDKLKTELQIDTNRIYITGLSMGGFGTFDAISRYPNMFAAAVPVCGGGDTSVARSISHIPIWIFHGGIDTVVSPDMSLDMVQALKNAGAHPGFTLYPETGHFSWIAAYSDPMMMEWLFRQRK